MLYFLKSWVFKDVKYDITMCQYHSTRPQPIQLVLTPASEACFKRISVLNDSICILWNDAILCSSSKSYISSHFFQVERGLSPKWGDFPLKGKCWGVLHISWSFVFIWSSFYTTVREGLKKNWEKAVRLTALGGGGGVTPPQPDHFYLWKFWTIFVLYKTTI